MLHHDYMNENKFDLKIMFFVISLIFTQSAFAVSPELQIQCGHDEQDGIGWNYCDHQLAGSTSQDVLYYFHGLYGSELEWQNSLVLDETYAAWGLSAPRVITISYGTVWLLAEKNEGQASGLYEHLVHTALPYLEKQLHVNPVHRLLMGASMGGFNASQVYLKNPELFYKVALACPAITSVSPYASSDEISSYISRTGALNSYVDTALRLSSIYFPSPESWSQSDPIELAKQRVTEKFPDLFVSGGTEDEFGFQEGGKIFAETVALKGAKATWTALPGLHCTYDVSGTAQFLISK